MGVIFCFLKTAGSNCRERQLRDSKPQSQQNAFMMHHTCFPLEPLNPGILQPSSSGVLRRGRKLEFRGQGIINRDGLPVAQLKNACADHGFSFLQSGNDGDEIPAPLTQLHELLTNNLPRRTFLVACGIFNDKHRVTVRRMSTAVAGMTSTVSCSGNTRLH